MFKMGFFDQWGVTGPPSILYSKDETCRLRWRQYLLATSFLLFYLFLHQCLVPLMINLALGRPWYNQLHWNWIVLAAYRGSLQRPSILAVHPSIPWLFSFFVLIRLLQELLVMPLSPLSWSLFSLALTEGSLLLWCFLHLITFPQVTAAGQPKVQFFYLHGGLIFLFVVSLALEHKVNIIPDAVSLASKHKVSAVEKIPTLNNNNFKKIESKLFTPRMETMGWNPRELYWQVSAQLPILHIKIRRKISKSGKVKVSQLQVFKSCVDRFKSSLIATYPSSAIESQTLQLRLPFHAQHRDCTYELRLWGSGITWPSLWILPPNAKWLKESPL